MNRQLDRLYKAAIEYYYLKETGGPMGNHTAEEIHDEMFSALLDICLPSPSSGKWFELARIDFSLEGKLNKEIVTDEDTN